MTNAAIAIAPKLNGERSASSELRMGRISFAEGSDLFDLLELKLRQIYNTYS